MNQRTLRVVEMASKMAVLISSATSSGWAQNAPAPPVAASAAPTAPPWVPPGYPPLPPGYMYVPVLQPKLTTPRPPHYLRYTEGQPIPEGYHLERDSSNGTILVGGLLGGVTYVLSATVAVGSTKNAKGFLFVPVLGPWLTLGFRSYRRWNGPSADPEGGWGRLAEAIAVLLLVEDGLLQAGGASAVIDGLANRRKKLVRNDLSWTFSPGLVGRGYGLSAVGTF